MLQCITDPDYRTVEGVFNATSQLVSAYPSTGVSLAQQKVGSISLPPDFEHKIQSGLGISGFAVTSVYALYNAILIAGNSEGAKAKLPAVLQLPVPGTVQRQLNLALSEFHLTTA